MKRDAVLQSTLELISELGVHNTPMSKIAKHADVAVGTIYHHFNSKDEILNELYLEVKREFGECCKAALDQSKNPKEAFSNIFKAVYELYTENPLKFIFTEQVAFTPIITEETMKESQSYYQSIITYFQEQIANGTFRDVPIELMGQLYYGNIKTLIQMKLAGEEVTGEMLKRPSICPG
jgi:AcrR family transcriptional regulator